MTCLKMKEVLLGFGMIITLDYYSDSRISELKFLQNHGLSSLVSISRLNGWTKELLIAPKNSLNVVFEHWKDEYTGTSMNTDEFLQSKVLEDLLTGTINEAQYTLIKEQWSVATKKLDAILAAMEGYSKQVDLSKESGSIIELYNQNDEYN